MMNTDAGGIRTWEEGALAAIFVLGPSSSGKTTLCDALARDLRLPPSRYITEVARTVMKETGFTRNDTYKYEMQAAIMNAQVKAEMEALQLGDIQAGELRLLSDRSAVDPIIYASTASTSSANETRKRLLESEAFRTVIGTYKRSLFVVLQPVSEWIYDDGVRSLEDPWNYVDTLRRFLEEYDIPFWEISESVKSLVERVALTKEYLRLHMSN
ncbi:hypothetical protein K474DRAFT_1116053 [Panus rudis PR-1116 ss-1]|nr:hypothetical protein K474DRAFT_1116053 [Panus rudis PR-1116 ss-1]